MPPVGDSGSVAEAAKLLVAAENPVIVADRTARTPEGLACLVDLAEALQCAVVDQAGRMNFPTRHPLNQSDRARAAIAEADVILGLDVADLYGITHTYRDQIERTSRSGMKSNAKAHHHQFGRPFHQGELSGFPALQRSGHRHCRGFAGDAAFADRGRQAPHHGRPQARISGSRRAAQGGAHAGARAFARRRGICVGRQSRSAPLACAWSSGDKFKMKTGRWSAPPRLSASGRSGCGILTSTINTSAARAAMASATTLRRPRARRWPIASTAA